MTATTLPRKLAALPAVAGYWAAADETVTVLPDLASHWIGWGEPFCFACGWLAPVTDGPGAWARASGWLDRAHLVDHWLGGSGEPSNLVALCHLCHDAMTEPFDDRDEALRWVAQRRSDLPHPTVWQVFTDAHGRSSGDGPRRARMLRLRGDYLALLLREGDAA